MSCAPRDGERIQDDRVHGEIRKERFVEALFEGRGGERALRGYDLIEGGERGCEEECDEHRAIVAQISIGRVE